MSTSKRRSLALSLLRLWPFWVWLAAFYAVWLTLVLVGNHVDTLRSHWPIALAMALGSYVAGSTPMGGGTVGFPVLVLMLDMPGALGRNFGLAIQSIGMVSASVFILSARIPVQWSLLRPALFGALIGTPVGCALVAPFIPDLSVKLTFAVVWASFGVMHLIKLRSLVAAVGIRRHWEAYDRLFGLSVGLVGGVVASITGVGIDMLIYALLVLLYRADLKIAIPTSVVIMAFTSVVGITANTALARLNPSLYGISPEVYANWLAAAPIVALGAPFGAMIVRLISRTPTLLFVSVLCIGQFIWTLLHEQVTGWPLAGSIAGLAALCFVFQLLYRFGEEPAAIPVLQPSCEVNLE